MSLQLEESLEQKVTNNAITALAYKDRRIYLGTDSGTIMSFSFNSGSHRLFREITADLEDLFGVRGKNFPSCCIKEIRQISESPCGSIAVGSDVLSIHDPLSLEVRHVLSRPREYFHTMTLSPDRSMLLVKHGNPQWSPELTAKTIATLALKDKYLPCLESKLTLFAVNATQLATRYRRRSILAGSLLSFHHAYWISNRHILLGPCHQHLACIYDVEYFTICTRLPSPNDTSVHQLEFLFYDQEYKQVVAGIHEPTAAEVVLFGWDPTKAFCWTALGRRGNLALTELTLCVISGKWFLFDGLTLTCIFPPDEDCRQELVPIARARKTQITSFSIAEGIGCVFAGTRDGVLIVWKIV